MKLKMIAIAAAAASLAGAAHADLTSGTSVNNGSIVLLATDITTLTWYMRDTGFLLNDFMPSSVTPASGDSATPGNKTPEAGLTLNSTNTASFADSTFNAWLTAQTSTAAGVSNVRWALTGYDLNGTALTNVKRLVTSSANPNETILNSQLDNYVGTANAGGLFNFFNPSANEFSVTGTGGANGFLSLWGLGTDGMAQVGSSASMFYASRSVPTGSTSANSVLTKFGNTAGFASVLLASNGDFSYTLAPAAAVPLPAAAWMMGAGLMAIGGMVRRRKAAAQA